MGATRRERILAVLAEHPEGLPTPQIAELVEENPQRGRITCWEMLRLMEQAGQVTRCFSQAPSRTVDWRLVPVREQQLYRALHKRDATLKALPPDERAALFAEFGPALTVRPDGPQ